MNRYSPKSYSTGISTSSKILVRSDRMCELISYAPGKDRVRTSGIALLTSRAQRRAAVLSGGAKQSCRRYRRIMARRDIGGVRTGRSTGSPCKPHIERNRRSVIFLEAKSSRCY